MTKEINNKTTDQEKSVTLRRVIANTSANSNIVKLPAPSFVTIHLARISKQPPRIVSRYGSISSTQVMRDLGLVLVAYPLNRPRSFRSRGNLAEGLIENLEGLCKGLG
jgi:hypothetical protein